jgi:two-component system chemotaxis response regulator CheB
MTSPAPEPPGRRGRSLVKVLVVDDSPLTVQTITRILEADPSLQVVGHALDGERALKAVEALHPDVITMDINMPHMDGIEATRRIVRSHGTPIVIVSAYASANSVAIQTLQALMQGAIESVQKPSGEIGIDLDMVRAELVAKVKAASRAKPQAFSSTSSRSRADEPERQSDPGRLASSQPEPERQSDPPSSWRAMPAGTVNKLVAIGVSTGGPSTLEEFVPAIPADYPLPIALVIHMPRLFIPILAENLAARSRIGVEVARDGEVLRPGRMTIAPAGTHMTVGRDLRAKLAPGPPVNGCVPSVDVLFDSIARDVAGRSLGLVLTGMGRDGARGLASMRASGSVTAAQDEATSVVYGMPRIATTSGAAQFEVSLGDMVKLLVRAAGRA